MKTWTSKLKNKGLYCLETKWYVNADDLAWFVCFGVEHFVTDPDSHFLPELLNVWSHCIFTRTQTTDHVFCSQWRAFTISDDNSLQCVLTAEATTRRHSIFFFAARRMLWHTLLPTTSTQLILDAYRGRDSPLPPTGNERTCLRALHHRVRTTWRCLRLHEWFAQQSLVTQFLGRRRLNYHLCRWRCLHSNNRQPSIA